MRIRRMFFLLSLIMGLFIYDAECVHSRNLESDGTSSARRLGSIIDFTMEQSINDKMPPFTFRLLGKWVEAWNDKELNANINVIQIKDNKGRIVQDINGLDALPPLFAESFGLHFADYNFDGYLDMALYMYEGGTMRNEPHMYWLWDNTVKQFVYNAELSEISDYSSVSINAKETRLECYTRNGMDRYIKQYYKYLDGKFIFVYSFETDWERVPDKKGEVIRHEIIKELIDGKIVTTEKHYTDTVDYD